MPPAPPIGAGRLNLRVTVDFFTSRLHDGNCMVTKSRNPDRTRRAILDAAVAEFAAVGPAGARIDAIAAAAGVNKRMLYHYFASKEGLFAAVLDDQLGSTRSDAPPASLAERYAAVSDRPDWIRLLMWEALAGDDRRRGVSKPRTMVSGRPATETNSRRRTSNSHSRRWRYARSRSRS